ncbi:MAG: extracellular solute-binding protein [Mesorhizobium sp.]|uniref:ABC transporter substrate-binding protein n=4 Tax=unclassified Mesorhizobium TaxID=325217 RepID=UPI000FE7C930|nr:extracellular solute-binding protein [Mesorhizobium sp.]RWC83366.1 MAG: extracellular solute-binding protein [Mesorhizobium sp.]RWF59487.1 MAG: extracellular solute-binding protein [Mesorhizobium sp.]
MERREFLKTSALLGVSAAVGLKVAGRAIAAGELRLLTWEGYAENAWVKDFEQANGVTVAKTYVGSNDEYMAKLAAGGNDYDLVVIVSSLARRAIDAGFVENLDLSLIPHFEQLYPRLKTVDFISKDKRVYGVPTFFGIEPVTVNAEAIPEGNDFGILFDKRYAGKIAMWDDVATLGEVANWMGIGDLWNMTDEQLEAVKQKLIEQKPLVRTYWSQPGEAIDLFMNKEIVASNSWMYVTKNLKAQGLAVRDFAASPPVGWIDSHFVVKGTPNREIAHKFIDHIVSPESQGEIAEITGYMPTNPGSKSHMKPETWEALRMEQVGETMDHTKFWEDIPRRSRYLQVLNEVKAA